MSRRTSSAPPPACAMATRPNTEIALRAGQRGVEAAEQHGRSPPPDGASRWEGSSHFAGVRSLTWASARHTGTAHAYRGRDTPTCTLAAPGCPASPRSRQCRAAAAGGPGLGAAATRGRRAPLAERGGAHAACREEQMDESTQKHVTNQGKVVAPAGVSRRGPCRRTAADPVSRTCRTCGPAGGDSRRRTLTRSGWCSGSPPLSYGLTSIGLRPARRRGRIAYRSRARREAAQLS